MKLVKNAITFVLMCFVFIVFFTVCSYLKHEQLCKQMGKELADTVLTSKCDK